MRVSTILALCAGLMTSPALACGPDTDCSIGDRVYRIDMPAGAQAPVPAILYAHGYKGTTRGVMGNRALRRMAGDLGMALIAAQSVGPGWDIPGNPRSPGSDGSGEMCYFEAVLEDAVRRFAIDRQQIFAAGFSAGGMMVWNLACNRPGIFAGFVPVAGTFWLGPPEACAVPMKSLVHIHGYDDPVVPLNGRPIGATRQGRVSESLEMYAEHGGFGTPTPRADGSLRCQERRNASGDLLALCLFPGGHALRPEYLRHALTRMRVIQGAE